MVPEVEVRDPDTGYHLEILGEYAERQQLRNRPLGVAVLSAVGIFLIRHLEREEEMPFGEEELLLRGAMERLSPILMTALTTGLALLPIVIGGNRPGQEIEHPMAIVIVGGLFTSTLLNLLFMRRCMGSWQRLKKRNSLNVRRSES